MTSDNPISFLIPLHNGLSYTRACLQSLEQTVSLKDHEVILVDDASTDGTREYVGRLTAPYRVLRNETRRNYAASMNRAAQAAEGHFLCLLNNDLIFTEGWLAPMLRAFELFSKVGFVGNVQINPTTGRYDHMGFVFSPDGVPWHFGKNFPFRPYRGYRAWRAVTAACCLIRKDVFLNAGGFDERYVNGSEDVDLCLRLGRDGYQHYVACESVVHHHGSVSEGRHEYNERNQARLLQMWRAEIVHSLTSSERRLHGVNYIVRHAMRPWKYNGPQLCGAVACVVGMGRRTCASKSK